MSSNSRLSSNDQKATSTMVHTCKRCSYKTLSITSIEDHVKSHKYQCLEKLFLCTDSALEQYTCDRCSYKTLFTVNLKKHIKRTHYIKTRGYFKEDELEKMLKRCKYKSCNFITYSRLVFLKHIHSKCLGRIKALKRLNIPITDDSALVEDGNWLKCDQCPYKTESNFFLTMHMSAEHGASTKENVNKTEHTSLAPEEVKSIPCEGRVDTLTFIEDEGEATTKCRFCFYEAKDTNDLRAHFLSEHTETTHDIKTYSCKKCHYVTRSKKGVQIHMKMKHKEAKSYPCPYCSFRGQKPSSLEQHMWKKYSEHIEWFSCKKCSYKTVFADALEKHNNDHDRSREESCRVDDDL